MRRSVILDARRTCLELDASAAAVPHARRHVKRTLAEWGLDACAADAETVTSELATNAVAASAALPHPARITLRIATVAGGLILAVADACPLPPAPLTADEDAEAGRGLAIVAALSTSWGCVPLPAGKIVWALFTSEAGD